MSGDNVLGAKETAEQHQSPAGGPGDWGTCKHHSQHLWKGSVPQKHLVMWETAQGEGKWASRTLGPPPSGAVLLLQLLRRATSITSGCVPSRSRGVECHDYLSGIKSLSSTHKLIRGDPSAQALPDKCKICMIHGLCVLLHLHFFSAWRPLLLFSPCRKQ